MSVKWKSKNIPYNMKGDKIEVKLMDDDFQPYYYKLVRLNDVKNMDKLHEDLEHMGAGKREIKKSVVMDYFE